MLIVPACQYSVGIGQSRLCGLHDGPGAGFPDHIHGEAVGFHPFVHELYFGADRTVIVDAEGLQDGVVILVILSAYFFCGFYGRNSFAVPCKTYGLDISDAGVIITHTVLDKVFDEINTGNNVGVRVPWIDWELVPDRDDIELYVYMAGGGCSLPGMAKVLMPLEGYEGIVRIIFDQMTSYGVNACPPVLLGVGIAGSAEVAAKLSKKALLRPVGSHNENPKAAMMEEELEKGLNELGLGPGGLSGKLSVMGVNIEQAARHPATLAVGISTACWAHRRACIKINPDFTYDFVTSKGVTL